MYERPYGIRNPYSAGNPTLEPNITSIGKPVAKLWPIYILKMAVGRHLEFYRTGNNAIRSADAKTHALEPNMEWIECTVCEIFTFKLYCDLETMVQGNSRSSKAALFNRAHLFSSSSVNEPLSIIQDMAAYWLKIAIPRCIRCPR